jgi:hypothetical protein
VSSRSCRNAVAWFGARIAGSSWLGVVAGHVPNVLLLFPDGARRDREPRSRNGRWGSLLTPGAPRLSVSSVRVSLGCFTRRYQARYRRCGAARLASAKRSGRCQ